MHPSISGRRPGRGVRVERRTPQVGKRATATYYVAATAAPAAAAAAYAFVFELKAKPLCACVWFLFLGTGGSELLDNRISGPVAVGEGGYRGL
jgi:hypothetical protein